MARTRQLLRTVRAGGDPDARFTVFAVMRDERFFLDAFLAHYRRLGVARFVILDDGSTDGSRERLLDQPDVTLLESDFGFGEDVDGARAVLRWKEALLRGACGGDWGLLLDADEFLALEGPGSLAALADRLERRGARSALAAMIDLYPATLAELIDPATTALDPEAAWWFDAGPYVAHGPPGARPVARAAGVKTRLARTHGLMAEPGAPRLIERLARRFGRRPPARFAFTPYKVPLVRIGPDARLEGSHWATPAPQPPDILPLAHFKFTADLPRKIEAALASRAYAMGSRAYEVYRDLLPRIERAGGSLLFDGSRRYAAPSDFYAAGSAVDGGAEES